MSRGISDAATLGSNLQCLAGWWHTAMRVLVVNANQRDGQWSALGLPMETSHHKVQTRANRLQLRERAMSDAG